MSEEALKAATRLMANSWETYIPEKVKDRNWMNITDEILGDGRSVARQHLAENDPTPVDGEWLRSVGFGNASTSETLSIDLQSGSALHHSPTLGWWWISASHGDKVGLGTIPTKGHVRRLCTALGIELKEKK